MTSQVLGVLLLFRHGDRQGFYQSPTSYSPTGTAITPLGEVQAYQLGQQLRARYLDPASPNAIEGISSGLIDNSQLYFSADAGGEGGVIYNSAVAVSQGLYPVSSASNTTLANGTSVTSPLGGYQYLPIESLEVEQDYSLESWTECPAYTADNAAWYQSDAFKAKAEENAEFLNSLAPIVGGRNVTLQNMWNIFDYINVNYIHNATFLQNTPLTVREQARALADWHEYTSFSDIKPDAIGNIAGRAMLPEMIEALQTFTNASQSQKMRAFGISYKPFVSLFNMTGVAEAYPQVAGVVDYTACMALEIRKESVTNSYTVTMQFKNGTADEDFAPYNMFGSSSAAYDLDTFVQTLEPYGVSSLGQWCNECQNTDSRGCATINAVNVSRADNGPASTTGTHSVSPLAAGFIGAVVAMALAAVGLATLFVLGMVSVGKKGSRKSWKARSEAYNLPAYEGAAANTADYK